MADKMPLTYGLTCEYCSSKGPLFVIEHPDPACKDYILCAECREIVLNSFQMIAQGLI